MAELKRSITWVQGTALTIGAVLGSGILILPALTATVAGPASLISWVVMSILSLPLALTLGRLAAKLPHAGGIVAYARHAFGPVIGAATGWLFIGTVPMGVPIVSLVGANYLGNLMNWSHWEVTGVAAVILLTSLLMNARGIEVSGWIQVLIVCLIAGLLVVAIVTSAPTVHQTAFVPFHPHGWKPVGVAAVMIFWCYVGWEMIVHLAEEFRNPSRDVPLSMGLSTFVIAALYLGIAVVTVGTHSYGQNVGLAPLSLLMALGFGKVASALTAVLALIITFATAHTNIAGFSRMMYAQAREGDFPRVFAKLHEKYQTPVVALVGLAVVFSCVLLVNGCFEPNLGFLIQWPSVIFIALYLIAMASALVILPRRDAGWWMGGVALIVCIVIYAFSGWTCLYPVALFSIGCFIAIRRRKAIRLMAGEVREDVVGD